jgi:hypothetical protein
MPKRKRNDNNGESTKQQQLATAAPSNFSTTTQAFRSAQSQAPPSRREAPLTQRCCPDQMVLGFPPARSRVDGGFPRRPSRRNEATQKRHRVRVRQADRDFSRPPPTKNSGATEHHHQTSLPTSTRHHGLVVTIPVSSRPLA